MIIANSCISYNINPSTERTYETVKKRVPTCHYQPSKIIMAKCDEGYLCCVCGDDVESITDSDLYLRYVIGMVDPELLHATPERHIRCNPNLAQFIVDERFKPLFIEGPWDKQNLDPAFVKERESLVTRGFQRLFEIKATEGISILDFPLPEAIERIQKRNSDS